MSTSGSRINKAADIPNQKWFWGLLWGSDLLEILTIALNFVWSLSRFDWIKKSSQFQTIVSTKMLHAQLKISQTPHKDCKYFSLFITKENIDWKVWK